ncbi:MAG: YdcF family protein [Deltaproteobacteria bacterium]|nr:YdcF family protein [Deltaproteobacteria bacterium]
MTFFFFLKKLAGRLILPPGLAYLLLAAGLILLFSRRRRLGRALVLTGTLILIGLSLPWVADLLARPLENRYPILNPAVLDENLAAIVVLSGGTQDRPDLPPAARLGSDTLQRVMEGVRLWRHRPGAKLILCGGQWENDSSDQTPARLMAAVARSLGVVPAAMVVETLSRDTYENAVEAVKLLEPGQFAVVTSARHMPRAVAIFRGLGLEPVPAPTDHQVRVKSGRFSWLPSAGGLALSQASLHEYLGYLWYWLKGRL